MSKILTVLITLGLLLGISFSNVRIVLAADMDFTCNMNGCSKVGAIFTESGMHPGKTVTKTLKVTNDFPNTRSFALEPTNFSDSDPSMADALYITITDSGSGSVIYGPDSLNDWKNEGFKSIGALSPGEARTYEFKIKFNDVGNDYAEQKLTFDIKLGFEPAPAGVASTGTPEVLGTSTLLGSFTAWANPGGRTPAPSPAPQVLGAECVVSDFPWWIFLIIEAAAFLVISVKAKKKNWGYAKTILALLIISGLSQIAHILSGCDCQASLWCSKYLFLNLGILLLAIASAFT